MGRRQVGLYWRPDTVAYIMSRNGIRNREQLAARLEPLGISRRTVYRSFTDDWNGKAADTVVSAIVTVFRNEIPGLSVAHLVIEV